MDEILRVYIKYIKNKNIRVGKFFKKLKNSQNEHTELFNRRLPAKSRARLTVSKRALRCDKSMPGSAITLNSNRRLFNISSDAGGLRVETFRKQMFN